MNKIEIFKPFGEAIELTKRILFQPFDIKKWFVIGFAAFLAQLGSGGGYNYRTNNLTGHNDLKNSPQWQSASDWFNSIPHAVLLFAIIAIVVFVLTLAVVFAWLRARGAFMFVDCIVKNRGAIAEPWHEFRAEGNSFFLFQLVVMLVFLVMIGLAALPFLLPIIRGTTFLHLHDAYLISVIVLWVGVVMIVAIAWAVVSQLMVVLMYRRRIRSVDAFRASLDLIASYPGEFVLYWLFWVVLGLGTVVVACLATCVTCCMTAVPYIGTVILLPVYVCLRGFALLFIRQFGPDYDAWGGVPPAPQPPPLPQPA